MIRAFLAIELPEDQRPELALVQGGIEKEPRRTCAGCRRAISISP